MKSAYLVIAHGSRDQKANKAFFDFLGKFRKKFPNRFVQGAFLEIAEPGIEKGLEACVAQGAVAVYILPMMFFAGRHAKEDIPRFIEDAKSRHPETDFHYASPLADHPLMLELLKKQAKALENKK
jgi:sirohydrochlorin ferrochelatase